MTLFNVSRKSANLSKKAVVLATDLDGTFLGGPEASRERLYDWIEENRASVGLIFVTGRDPGFIRDLTRKGNVPRPDYVVGDVGTTIAAVDEDHFLTPIEDLERRSRQPGRMRAPAFRRRCTMRRACGCNRRASGTASATTWTPTGSTPAALDIVAEMGLDALVSDNRYFDVLPKDVSKGPSLLRLLTHLGVANERCLVAGDTLNDLSMLSLGLPAVAVGNSEPALRSALEGQDHVHFASGHGAAGIAEAILALDVLRRDAA
jgi:HAD superfamily hydrolase (TIGR01484 family)